MSWVSPPPFTAVPHRFAVTVPPGPGGRRVQDQASTALPPPGVVPMLIGRGYGRRFLAGEPRPPHGRYCRGGGGWCCVTHSSLVRLSRYLALLESAAACCVFVAESDSLSAGLTVDDLGHALHRQLPVFEKFFFGRFGRLGGDQLSSVPRNAPGGGELKTVEPVWQQPRRGHTASFHISRRKKWLFRKNTWVHHRVENVPIVSHESIHHVLLCDEDRDEAARALVARLTAAEAAPGTLRTR